MSTVKSCVCACVCACKDDSCSECELTHLGKVHKKLCMLYETVGYNTTQESRVSEILLNAIEKMEKVLTDE